MHYNRPSDIMTPRQPWSTKSCTSADEILGSESSHQASDISEAQPESQTVRNNLVTGGASFFP
jgi:hypothetical protein